MGESQTVVWLLYLKKSLIALIAEHFVYLFQSEFTSFPFPTNLHILKTSQMKTTSLSITHQLQNVQTPSVQLLEGLIITVEVKQVKQEQK